MKQFVVLALTLNAVFAAGMERKGQGVRQPDRNGWIFVHLEGSPAEVGLQHGYLLAPEIADAKRVIAKLLEHDTKKDWNFYRTAAKDVLWRQVNAEYRAELEGITKGLAERGVAMDLWDVIALNGWMELGWYYAGWFDTQNGIKSPSSLAAPEHCSAFVATGSYTKDGKPVMAHNAWVDYSVGVRWNIIFDIKPEKGQRFVMDGFPGLIHSGDDFGINDAGLMITETTISGFKGFDPKGIPEFQRAREAMQYAKSIDEFADIMKRGNNGGYANNWLVADRNTGEIASLELGLKNVTLKRTKDGYFRGSNFPENEKLLAEETDWKDADNPGASPNARRTRWDQLMAAHKGKIDVAAGKKFMADDYDVIEKKRNASERTLCGRIDLSPRGSMPWQPEFGMAGAVQNKVVDSTMAGRLEFSAAMGMLCGEPFHAASHLKAHPEYAWQSDILKDFKRGAWTVFRALP